MDIIKAKIYSDGDVKGRPYTYKSDIDVNVGDFVLADMAGREKVLQVVEIGVPQSEIEGIDYEIKTIIGLTEEPSEESQFDLRVEEETLPVIRINYEEIKNKLSDAMGKYKGLVVTPESLPACKAIQRELAGLRLKLDTYRKDKKKVLSAPIADFENQCKELIALVESVEKPIKEGISVFDDERRRAKREAAEKLITEVAEAAELRAEFAEKLTVIDKYCNLTAKESDVKADLESRAFALKVEQDREDELIEIISSAIDTENERINQKLSLSDFRAMISSNIRTADIINEIKRRAQQIYAAEHPAPEPVKTVKVPKAQPQEAKQAPQPEKVVAAAHDPEVNDPVCFAVYKVVGKLSALREVSALLKNNDKIICKTAEQGVL